MVLFFQQYILTDRKPGLAHRDDRRIPEGFFFSQVIHAVDDGTVVVATETPTRLVRKRLNVVVTPITVLVIEFPDRNQFTVNFNCFDWNKA